MSAAGAYVVGSIPFGLLIGLAQGVDIRKHGSGNVGATNCGRVLGRKWGVLCLVLDMLKGLLPVLVAGWALGWLGCEALTADQAWRWLAVGFAAFVGHIYPVWLKFRGGKGVATGFGVILGIYPALTGPALAAVLTWMLLAWWTRYISVASMLAVALLPVFLAIRIAFKGGSRSGGIPFFVVTIALAALVVSRHHSNLSRLFRGEEPKWGGNAYDHADTEQEGRPPSPGTS